jgi:methionine-rich copper-binding protein CopC
MRKTRNLAIVALAAGILAGAPAWAHTELVSSDPASGATVAPPETITLIFSEEIAPAFSGFNLAMVGRDMTVQVETELAEDGKTLVGALEKTLTPGAYTIAWHVASGDGHRMTGEIPFDVE